MTNPLRQMQESDRKQFVAESLTMARTALGLRPIDLVRQYPTLLSKATLSNYEAGIRWPSPIFLIQLCEDYGLSMDWFYRRSLGGVSEKLAKLLREKEPSA